MKEKTTTFTFTFTTHFKTTLSIILTYTTLNYTTLFFEGASVRDSHQTIPLKLAVKQGATDFRVVRALIRAYPQGPSIQGDH